jgi:hypothetical protein
MPKKSNIEEMAERYLSSSSTSEENEDDDHPLSAFSPSLRRFYDRATSYSAAKNNPDNFVDANQPPTAEPSRNIVYTELGTPCSPKWCDDWIAEVNETEAALGRNCCGAHAPDDKPCQLGSTHENGRCRFHGGAKNIGAPEGNHNAYIHGLYSRRLKTCGSHCPLWDSCPMAGRDVLEIPESNRPICHYEQEEYDALSDLMDAARPQVEMYYEYPSEPKPHPMRAFLKMAEHNVKLLQVMLTRAATTLRNTDLTTDTKVQSKDYSMASTKTNPMLQAFLILKREHRATTNEFKNLIKEHGHPQRYRFTDKQHKDLRLDEDGYLSYV